jgi:hypothetical protein
MVPTTYQCVNKIWYPWWVPYFIHTLIRGGYHILFTHWYVVGTIFYSHIDTWWVPYFIHTLIRGGYRVNKIWYPPCINMWIKYGTHHVSMCEQNMVPTTYQCVNKIWHPPLIGCHILFTHWCVVGVIFYSHIDTWWVPYFIHTLMRGWCHILFTHWCVVGVIFYSHIDTWWGTHHVSMCE